MASYRFSADTGLVTVDTLVNKRCYPDRSPSPRLKMNPPVSDSQVAAATDACPWLQILLVVSQLANHLTRLIWFLPESLKAGRQALV